MNSRLSSRKVLWNMLIQLFSFSILSIPASSSEFGLVGKMIEYPTSHYSYLGIYPTQVPDGKMYYWSRKRDSKNPGDYFMTPDRAESAVLTNSEFLEIKKLLSQNVYDYYFDDFAINNIKGYEYTFADSNIWRREYYLRYTSGDTIYVISGWLGKFFSFYRAVPGDFRYDENDLRREVKKITPTSIKTNNDSFKRIDEDMNYLLEYIDKPNKMRIRNYLFYARFEYGVSGEKGKTYNLIEITKFIDKEVIP